MNEILEKDRQAREDALYNIANWYLSLSNDEKEGLKRLTKDKGKEVRREKLLNKRDKINKELGIHDTSSPNKLSITEEDYKLLNNLYKHVCKEFKRVTDELLGEDYYNMGMDQYTCATMTADDIIRKYKKRRK